MKQRASRSEWLSPHRSGHRPRLLIEDDRPALAISDFSLFHDAGFDVAFCSGPGEDPHACPVMHGQACPLPAAADVVLHGLDPALGIAAAIRRQCPQLPVVIEQRRDEDGSAGEVPDGCLPLRYASSVSGQVAAVRRALAAAASRAGTD
ncbi:hypothetical protein EAS64_14905 [Trebonia kvetii]|uniref:Response regulator n=1 Tax=Trebonia kvetii TaxID=2480626 RepID=A0A6P2C2N2_9ACTN|nr:hypothetical protein [Trebonia kvetii]TVZ03753.1 hypothetical protein EAS64_14905 [Trebonia kvetii]